MNLEAACWCSKRWLNVKRDNLAHAFSRRKRNFLQQMKPTWDKNRKHLNVICAQDIIFKVTVTKNFQIELLLEETRILN